MTIVITGGSGYVGSLLTKTLIEKGKTVVVVDIEPPSLINEKLFFIQCDLSKQVMPFNVLDKADVVINLVGKNIFSKWTNKYKKGIVDSRTNSTKNVVDSIKETRNRPTVLINASAVGFYGERGNEILTDGSGVGVGFFSETVSLWEEQAMKAAEFGTRVVCMRSAPIFGNRGGILKTIKKFSRFGFLSLLTKRDFWQPWVHERDAINAYLFAIETSTLQGPVNIAAPGTIKHREFMVYLSKYMGKVLLGSIPGKLGKLVFGDLLQEMTKSQNVTSKKLVDKGFVFQYPTLDLALGEIFNKKVK